MALHDAPESYETVLDRVTGHKLMLVMAALQAGGQINTNDMIERLGEHLGSDAKLGSLIQRTARGENAFRELLLELAKEAAHEQAVEELADAPRRRREQAAESRAEQARWHAQIS